MSDNKNMKLSDEDLDSVAGGFRDATVTDTDYRNRKKSVFEDAERYLEERKKRDETDPFFIRFPDS